MASRGGRRGTAAAGRAPLTRTEPGLPGRWYTDEAHYRRELRVFWSRSWIAVLREEELAAPGDLRAVEIGGQPLLVLRNDAGELRAFHNVCRHRGSVLCPEASGRLRGGRIVCPYHAWTYDSDGRLVATPRRMPAPDFDAAKLALHPVRVDSWGGFVFVHLDRRARPLTAALGDLPARLERHGLGRLRIGRRIECVVEANWKLIAENFSECYHCPVVHPELCRVVPAYREAGAWGLRRDAAGRALPEDRPEYRAGAATLTPDGKASIPPFAGLAPDRHGTLYRPAMLPPNLFLNVHPDYVNAHMMFPLGPGRVRMVYDWLFEPESLARPGFDLGHYVSLWDTTNRQDARNCEWQQRGLHSSAYRRGLYVPQEFDCHRYAQWVRRALRTGRPVQRPM